MALDCWSKSDDVVGDPGGLVAGPAQAVWESGRHDEEG